MSSNDQILGVFVSYFLGYRTNPIFFFETSDFTFGFATIIRRMSTLQLKKSLFSWS